MDLEHAEDASPANRVASGLHFRPQAMRAVVLTLARKFFAHGYLSIGFGQPCCRCHAQYVAGATRNAW